MIERIVPALEAGIFLCFIAISPILISSENAKAEESRAAMVTRCKGVEHRVTGELLSKYPEAIAKAILQTKDNSGRVVVGNAVDRVIEREIYQDRDLASTFWHAQYQKANCLNVTACEGGQCWITNNPNDPYLVKKGKIK
jgi:hypothetical protein